jgi:hypothetical protein
VVSTPLKNISQLGVLIPINIYIWKNAIHVPNHHPVMVILPGMMIKPQPYGYPMAIKNVPSHQPATLW